MRFFRLILALVAALTATLLGPVATAGAVGPGAGPTPAAGTWQPVYRKPAGESTLTDVVTTLPGHVWAAGTIRGEDGYDRPTVLRTVDGVTTSLPFRTDFTDRWGRFSGVGGVADDDMWAVGLLVYKATGFSIPLLAHWNGTVWTQVPLPLPAGTGGELVAVSARSAQDVWFAGTVADLDAARLFHWDGRRITQVPVTVADPTCSAPTATVTDVVTTAGAVWLSLRCQLNTDGRSESSVQRLRGGVWASAFITPPSGGIVGLGEDGTGLVLAVGFRSVVGGSVPILAAGRSTLREVASFPTSQFFWAVAARAGAVYLVGQVPSNDTPLVLRRNGSSFVQESIDGDQPLFGVTVDDAGTAWAVGPAFGGSFSSPRAGLWQRVTT